MTNDKLICLMMQACCDLVAHDKSRMARKSGAALKRAIAKAHKVEREYQRRRLGLMRDELNRHVGAKAARADGEAV